MTVMEEEVTLKRKFAWWKVYKNGKWEYWHTAKRMTTDEALKYFGAITVIGQNDGTDYLNL